MIAGVATWPGMRAHNTNEPLVRLSSSAQFDGAELGRRE